MHTLLHLGVAANGDLDNRSNQDGLTPLEICKHIMIRMREVRYVHPSGRQYPRDSDEAWVGNTDEHLMIAKLLR